MKTITTSLVVLASMASVVGCGSNSSGGSGGGSGGSNGTPDAGQVASDLDQLLTSKNVTFSNVNGCTHQSGNQFVCEVDGGNPSPQFLSVTDDGSRIFEQPEQ